MAKTIDLNERALEQEKKQYNSLCRILKFFSAYCLICPPCIVAIIICRLLVEKPFDGMYMVAAHEMIMCLTTFLVFNHLFRLFKKLGKSETPFRYDIGDTIKSLGITLFSGSAIALVFRVIIGNVYPEVSDPFYNISMNCEVPMLIFGIFLGVFAYIFNYGCKLQQESDETI